MIFIKHSDPILFIFYFIFFLLDWLKEKLQIKNINQKKWPKSMKGIVFQMFISIVP